MSFALFLALLAYVPPGNGHDLLTAEEVATRPQIPADHRIFYRPHVFQFGDLRLPKGNGPHPVAVIIHGGCWSARFGLHIMDQLARRLAKTGIATWNIEFRRVGQGDYAWPNIFDDVRMAVRHVENLAEHFHLNLRKTVLIGHSSGAHLALWMASRLPKNNAASGLFVTAVVALAPVTDLAAVSKSKTLACNNTIQKLMGGSFAKYPERYQSVSPWHIPIKHIPIALITGLQDEIISSRDVQRYATQLESQGAYVQHTVVEPSGHFELISPGAGVWPEIERVIMALF